MKYKEAKMKKIELNTRKLKKLLNAVKITQEWHNKNKTGGNFGLNFYFGETFERGRDKSLSGYYNRTGDLYSLSYGDAYGIGQQIPQEILKDIDLLAKYLLHLAKNGDWIKFLVDNGLFEEYKKRQEFKND